MSELNVMLVMGLLASGPTLAEAPRQSANQKNPSEVLCVKHEVTGSRLASVRVCKTRAEWAEERRVTQQEIDQIQTQRRSKDFTD